jgi:hypothetical protein
MRRAPLTLRTVAAAEHGGDHASARGSECVSGEVQTRATPLPLPLASATRQRAASSRRQGPLACVFRALHCEQQRAAGTKVIAPTGGSRQCLRTAGMRPPLALHTRHEAAYKRRVHTAPSCA